MPKAIIRFNAIMALLLPAIVQAAPIKNTSIYTGLAAADCKVLEFHEDEGGWSKSRCPGVSSYKLDLLEGDLRQSITIIDPKGKEYPLEFWNVVSVGFSSLGTKAEWRVQKQGSKVTPQALIVRFNASEDPEKPEKTTSYLVVSKITPTGSCVTDVVKPSTNANEQARTLADSAATRPCRSSH